MTDLFGSEQSHRSAVISECGLYRYSLSRVWDSSLPTVAWCCLNPSVADAEIDDPSVRRMMGFARRWGCGSVVVVNLFAFRATDPDDLVVAQVRRRLDVVGPENDAAILAAAASAKHLVAAWGASSFAKERARVVRTLLRQYGEAMECLGLTKAGHPRHPLYVKSDAELVPFSSEVQR